MTKAIIFDLDSCLSPADEPGQELFAPAFDAITRANHGSHDVSVLQQAFADMWRLPFDFVAEKYRFTPEMKDAGWKVMAKLEVTKAMSGYGDLDVLKKLPVLKFVVTSGFRRLQESKIRALGIAPVCTAIYIDAIDEPVFVGNRKSSRKFSAPSGFSRTKCLSSATITTPKSPRVSAWASAPSRPFAPVFPVHSPPRITFRDLATWSHS